MSFLWSIRVQTMENCCRLLNSFIDEIHVKTNEDISALNCFLNGVAMEDYLLIPMTLNRKSLPLEHSFWLTSVFTQTGRWSFCLCYCWCRVTGPLKTLIPVSILHWLGVFVRRTWNSAKSTCLFCRVNLETANILMNNTDSNYRCFRQPQKPKCYNHYADILCLWVMLTQDIFKY